MRGLAAVCPRTARHLRFCLFPRLAERGIAAAVHQHHLVGVARRDVKRRLKGLRSAARGDILRPNAHLLARAVVRRRDQQPAVRRGDGRLELRAAQVAADGRLDFRALDNIRERLRTMCGGTLAIEPRDGGGTKVTVFVPARSATS